MNHTNNYKLPQWSEEDRILMQDFNQMCADIDAGIAAAQTAADNLAKSAEEDISALQAAVGTGGSNCRIETGTYTGNGAYGAAAPNTLTFSITPLLVFIQGTESIRSTAILPRGCTMIHYEGGDVPLSWSEKSVSWYNNQSNVIQCNEPDVLYHYFAVGTGA